MGDHWSNILPPRPMTMEDLAKAMREATKASVEPERLSVQPTYILSPEIADFVQAHPELTIERALWLWRYGTLDGYEDAARALLREGGLL